jgi:DNA modification methylase
LVARGRDGALIPSGYSTPNEDRQYRSLCGKCGARRIDRQIGLEATPEEWLATLVGVFREVRRVLHPTGTVWCNVGDVFRDKQLQMLPARLALALQADGWVLRQDIIWSKPNPLPESVTDRPTSAHEHVFLLAKQARYFYDSAAVAEPALQTGGNGQWGPRGDARRNPATRCDLPTEVKDYATRSLRNVWSIATEAFPDAHFATYPTALVERCIKAGTSARGCCAACGAPWARERGDAVPIEGRGAGNGFKREARLSYTDGNGPRGDDTIWTPKAYPTTGWAPSCQCKTLRCLSCAFVLDTTHENRKASTKHRVSELRSDVQAVDQRSEVLQPVVLRDGKPDAAGSDLLAVREGLSPAHYAQPVLFEALCSEMDRKEPIHNKGVDDHHQRLQANSQARPSEGERGWLRDGASVGDGKVVGPLPDGRGGSSPQEREQERQSVGQSGVDAEAPTRQRQETAVLRDMPALPTDVPDTRPCPHCGSRTAWTTPNTVPAVVLDCFIGSGTTALVADRLQRDAIGIDLNTSYAEMAVERCRNDAPLLTEFDLPAAEPPEDARMADLFTELEND